MAPWPVTLFSLCFWTCAQTAQLSFNVPLLSLMWDVASVWFSRLSIILPELQLQLGLKMFKVYTWFHWFHTSRLFSTVIRLDTLRSLQLLWRSYLRRHEIGLFAWACMSSYCLTFPGIVWRCLMGFDDLGFLSTLSWSGAELTATTGTFRRPSCEDLSANERPLQAWNC